MLRLLFVRGSFLMFRPRAIQLKIYSLLIVPGFRLPLLGPGFPEPQRELIAFADPIFLLVVVAVG